MRTIIHYIKALLDEFKKDNVPILAAAQAYYYLLAIIPLLIVCFAIIPYLNMDPTEVMSFLARVLPDEIADLLEENIISLIETPKGGLLTFGIIGTLWSASNGIKAFMKATNEAYGVDETRSFIKSNATALGLTIAMILSFAIALLLPVFGNVILSFIHSFVDLSPMVLTLIQSLRWILSIVIITIILSVLYRFAPNKRLPIKHIIPGALTASISWLTISFGFSFYVSNFGNYTATYGSLGGLIVLMTWFFLTGMILMIGAEINVIYHRNNRVD